MRKLELAVFAVIAGCSSNPGPGGEDGGGGSGGVALADYCAGQAEARCAWEIRCGSAAPGADCEKLQLATRIALVDGRSDCLSVATRAGLDAGRTHYDGVKAARCFAAASTSAGCATNLVFMVPECYGIFTGTAASNAPCYSSSDCASGLYCDSTAKVCPGACQPQVGAGDFPTNLLACPPGTIARMLRDGGAMCQIPVDPGQPCGTPPGGLSPLSCAGANSCQPAGDGGFTCQALRGAGQTCGAMGRECGLDAPGAFTDAGFRCVPLGRSGQPCGESGCQAGLACVAGSCGPLVSAGGSCSFDRDCIARHYCATSGTCQPFTGPDSACSNTAVGSACEIGLFCNGSGRCEARFGAGVACTGPECNFEQGLTCPVDGGASSCTAMMCLPPL